MTKYIYQGKDLYHIISDISDIVLSPPYEQYVREANLDRHQMAKLLDNVMILLNNNKELYFDEDNSAKNILHRWKLYGEETSSMNEVKRIKSFIHLWDRTENLLHEISSGFKIGFNDSEEIVRKRAEEDVNADIQSLDKIRNEILTQIDQEKSKGNEADKDLLATLEKSLGETQSQIEQMQKEKEEVKIEKQAETNWDKRIEDAFNILKGCTISVEEEKKKANNEYSFYYHALMALVILVLLWMLFLYLALFSYHVYFTDWKSFLPYYLPIPILVALCWVFIVQKNRANKLSITMSEELFRIRYLEGLLLSVNKLSKSSDISINRINKAIDSMVESYLHQTERNFLTEDKISAIEKKELNTNKMMQWMDKLIDKV